LRGAKIAFCPELQKSGGDSACISGRIPLFFMRWWVLDI